MSPRHYWTVEELKKDAEYQRSYEKHCRSKAELNPDFWLRKANTAKLRAIAYETMLATKEIT